MLAMRTTLTRDDDLAGLLKRRARELGVPWQLGTARNLTTDAHLAVLAMERGYVLYSTGTDFARFPALRWVNPCEA